MSAAAAAVQRETKADRRPRPMNYSRNRSNSVVCTCYMFTWCFAMDQTSNEEASKSNSVESLNWSHRLSQLGHPAHRGISTEHGSTSWRPSRCRRKGRKEKESDWRSGKIPAEMT